MARAVPKSQIDLIPVMNLVTILIPFLLMSAAFTSVAVVDVNVQAAGEPSGEEPEKRPSLVVTGSGFVFHGADETQRSLPCPGGCRTVADYDMGGLKTALADHKASLAGDSLELITGDDVPYDVLIAVMDASRRQDGEDLYPNVIFGSLPEAVK